MKHLTLILSILLAGCAGPGGIAPREQFAVRLVDGRALTLSCPIVTREQIEGVYAVAGWCVVVRD